MLLIGTGVKRTTRGVAFATNSDSDAILQVSRQAVLTAEGCSRHAEADTSVLQAASLASTRAVLIVSGNTDVLLIAMLACASGQLLGKQSILVRRKGAADVEVGWPSNPV